MKSTTYNEITFHKLSWQDLERDCVALSQKLKSTEIDTIVAISRGGLVIARILSDLMEKPISHITITSYANLQKEKEPFIDEAPSKLFKDESILVLDEICDTGKTFERARAYFQNFPLRGLFTATPYVKPHTTYQPNFSVKTVEGWIVFPYEVRETAEALLKMTKDAKTAATLLQEMGFEDWEYKPFIS